MPSARSLECAVEAEDDIAQIPQYTLETWGDTQLLRYAADFDRLFDLIVSFPNLETSRIGTQIYSRRMREHVIYYSIHPERIVVRRYSPQEPGSSRYV